MCISIYVYIVFFKKTKLLSTPNADMITPKEESHKIGRISWAIGATAQLTHIYSNYIEKTH
jgi:hypothetical protein